MNRIIHPAVWAILVAAGLTVAAEPTLDAVKVECAGQPPVVEVRESRAFLYPGECRETLLVSFRPGEPESDVREGFPDSSITLVEKPGWPQVLSGTFASHYPTLARLSNNAGLATIASRENGDTLAFAADGSQIPGWPVALATNFADRMGAALDIDADGLDELLLPARTFSLLDDDGSMVPGWPKEGLGGSFPIVFRFASEQPIRILTGAGTTVSVLDTAGVFLPGWPVSIETFSLGDKAIGDVNGDGVSEVVLVVPEGDVLVFDSTGAPLPGFPASSGGTNLQTPTLGDLDGDGVMEIVVQGSPIVPGAAGVTVLRGDGTTFPGWPQSSGPATNRGVALGDVDGDGELELAASTVNGGPLLAGRVNLWNADGTPLPGWPKQVPNVSFPGNTILADVDGDGIADVVTGGIGPSPFPGLIYAWKATGELIPGFPITIPGRPIFEGPLVADIDEDGIAELGVMSEPGLFGGSGPQRLHWFDLGVPYRPEGMQWPTRAHDQARTGAYSQPVNIVEMRTRVVPPVLSDFIPANRIRVIVRTPGEEELRPAELSLVGVDGEAIRPIPGEFLKSTSGRGRHRAPSGKLIFEFHGSTLREVIDSSGLHRLRFRSELIGGLGGTLFEGEAWVIALASRSGPRRPPAGG